MNCRKEGCMSNGQCYGINTTGDTNIKCYVDKTCINWAMYYIMFMNCGGRLRTTPRKSLNKLWKEL